MAGLDDPAAELLGRGHCGGGDVVFAVALSCAARLCSVLDCEEYCETSWFGR